jgi:hypothetical protein
MPDDPPPPQSSAKGSEKKEVRLSALVEQLAAAKQAAAFLRYQSPSSPPDNRTLFIEAMSDPAKRQIAFNVVERNCRARFAEGEEGIKLYLQLLADVQRSNIDAAMDEFEKRFIPLLDQALLKTKFEQAKKG